MAIHHFVSRGVEAARKHGENLDWQKTVHEIPTSVMGLLFLTMIGYLIMHVYIQYVYGTMVPVLVVTEAPQQTTVIKTTQYRDEIDDEADKNPDAPLLTKEEKEAVRPIDEEVLVIAHKPITAKLRTTIKHLQERTGSKRSRFAGAGGYIIYTTIALLLEGLTRPITPGLLSLLRIPILASICTLPAAWVQSVVAMPKQRGFFQLVREMRRNGHYKVLFLSTMLVEAASMFLSHLPRSVMITADGINQLLDRKHQNLVMSLGAILMFFLTFFWAVTFVIPLSIGLTRLQASLLPEEVETVIPIDRTLGMADKKSIKTAWASFSRGGYWRLIKTFIKVGLMQLALAFVFVAAIFIELRFGAKKQLDNAVHQTVQAYRK